MTTQIKHHNVHFDVHHLESRNFTYILRTMVQMEDFENDFDSRYFHQFSTCNTLPNGCYCHFMIENDEYNVNFDVHDVKSRNSTCIL